MGREEHFGPRGAVVQLLHHRPGDGQAVERRRAAPDLVQQHQAPGREVGDDRGRLHHLDQERRLTPREVVLRAHAREHPVHQADARGARGDEGADVREHDQVAGLAEVDGLAGHVRPGEDHDARLAVERQVVGRHRLPGARLQHRMAPVHDVERRAVVHERTHVAAYVGDLGQSGHDVERGQGARGGQQVGRARRDAPADLVEQLVLEPAPPLLGAEHLGLVLLQLGGDVALGAGQRLAPHVLGGHPRRLRVRHLDAVAEHAVEAHAQARQPGPGALALLEPGDPAARLGGVAGRSRPARRSRSRE